MCIYRFCRSQWLIGLTRGSAGDRLLELRVRIPPGVWMSVSCECRVLSGRGLCDGPIPLPEESYRLWRVNACDSGTSRIWLLWHTLGCCFRETNNICRFYKQIWLQCRKFSKRCVVGRFFICIYLNSVCVLRLNCSLTSNSDFAE